MGKVAAAILNPHPQRPPSQSLKPPLQSESQYYITHTREENTRKPSMSFHHPVCIIITRTQRRTPRKNRPIPSHPTMLSLEIALPNSQQETLQAPIYSHPAILSTVSLVPKTLNLFPNVPQNFSSSKLGINSIGFRCLVSRAYSSFPWSASRFCCCVSHCCGVTEAEAEAVLSSELVL